MRVMPAHEYNGYTIVVNARPAPGGGFYSVYSIHKDSRTAIPSQLSLVHQEGDEASVICISEEQAHADAEQRAHAWVDAHPR